MFTGLFDIEQSDFPRQKKMFLEVLHKLKDNGLCDVRNDKSTIKQ